MSDQTVTDQASTQSTQDQVNADSSVREQPKQDSQVVEVNGETLSLEELKAGYMRQKDYTKKTQEIAEVKRSFARNSSEQPVVTSQDDETTQAIQALKGLGVVTKEDLALERQRIQAEIEDKARLDALIQRNPDLAPKRKALELIGKNDNRAWEDLVVDYGFLEKGKLSKTSNHTLVGDSQVTKQTPKSISEMSNEEYEEWKKAKLSGKLLYK